MAKPYTDEELESLRGYFVDHQHEAVRRLFATVDALKAESDRLREAGASDHTPLPTTPTLQW